MTAQALWYTQPGQAEIRDSRTGDGDVLVETLWSGLSRGTERLISRGGVPITEYARMRAPAQEGDFPFPVKYGYAAVGRVLEGPDHILGRPVFSLVPHQTRFRADARSVTPLPDTVPARRATLAANMETALNAIWDANPPPGTSVAVIGAGLVGCLTAYLLRVKCGLSPVLVDKIDTRAATANEIGVRFVSAADMTGVFDMVFHTSANEHGLSAGLNALAFEGTLIEMSWYGERDVSVPLGGAFHSQRLRIVASQVGHVSQLRRHDTTYAARMAEAIGLLSDPALDALITSDVPFAELPQRLGDLFADDNTDLAVAIQYPTAS